MTKLTIEELLEQLKNMNDRTRYRARLELSSRETKDVIAAAQKWAAALDKSDAEYEHHMLEALWLHQAQNVVNEELLKRMLTSPDYRARAAATHVLSYWQDRVTDPLALLQKQINDEHPRVRLEAVRALSFLQTPKASEVALEALIHPMDKYLQYTLGETNKQLNKLKK